MVLWYTLVYITDILPMFIRNIVIVKVEIFLEELLVLKRENCLRLLFTVCNFMLRVRLNFVGQLVLYSGAYLSDRHQIYLTWLVDGWYFMNLIDLVTYTRQKNGH